MPGFLKGVRLEHFEVLQHALVPRSQTFTELQRKTGFDLVNQLLERRSRLDQLKLSLFMKIILGTSYLKFGRSFSRLDPEDQSYHLNRFFSSRVGLFRKGFWGLNTLAKCSVYGQKALYDEWGYDLRTLNHE